MKILVACEFSGVVRDAFIRRGHDVISCDILPTEAPGPHYQGDVKDILDSGFDLMIAHPPCFRLSKVSGAHWKKDWFKIEQLRALEFVQLLMNAPIKHIAIENPVGKINSAIRKADQIIHPYMFGDPWLKETCLWLKNLPLLKPTNIIEPRGNWVKPGNKRPDRKFYFVPEGGNRNWKDRSRTFPGISEAMAEQWG
jgi:hypothetical protein